MGGKILLDPTKRKFYCDLLQNILEWSQQRDYYAPKRSVPPFGQLISTPPLLENLQAIDSFIKNCLPLKSPLISQKIRKCEI